MYKLYQGERYEKNKILARLTSIMLVATIIFTGFSLKTFAVEDNKDLEGPIVNQSNDNIYVTIGGDNHVIETDDLMIKKGTNLSKIKELSKENVVIEDGYEIESWNINTPQGKTPIYDDYIFNESSLIYITTKAVEAPQDTEENDQLEQSDQVEEDEKIDEDSNNQVESSIFINLDGDQNVKGSDESITIKKGSTLGQIKDFLLEKITISEGFEVESWNVEENYIYNKIDDNYTFNQFVHIYVKTKAQEIKPDNTDEQTDESIQDESSSQIQTSIFITLDGDEHVLRKDGLDKETLGVYESIVIKKGSSLSEVKKLFEEKIALSVGYVIDTWNIREYDNLQTIDDSHVFNESAHVYIKTISKDKLNDRLNIPEKSDDTIKNEDTDHIDIPDEMDDKVKLNFVETDVLKVGFVGGTTTSYMVKKDVKLSEQGIKLPEAGVELTVSAGYKPAFRFDSKYINNLDFSIDKESTIFIDAIPEKDNETTYSVNYQFIGNLGPDLPQEIMARLPKSEDGKKNGEIVTPVDLKKEDKIFETEEGTWNFDGWNVSSKKIDHGSVTFFGYWHFTKKAIKNYQLKYIFESRYANLPIPEEVKAKLSKLETKTMSNDEVLTFSDFLKIEDIIKQVGEIPSKIISKDKKEVTGVWKVSNDEFNYVETATTNKIDKNFSRPVTSDISISIKLDFEEREEKLFNAKFEFKSDNTLYHIPQELKDRLINTNILNNLSGTKINPSHIDTSDFVVKDGTWKFVAWDHNEQTIVDKDIIFVVTWVFKAKEQTPDKDTNLPDKDQDMDSLDQNDETIESGDSDKPNDNEDLNVPHDNDDKEHDNQGNIDSPNKDDKLPEVSDNNSKAPENPDEPQKPEADQNSKTPEISNESKKPEADQNSKAPEISKESKKPETDQNSKAPEISKESKDSKKDQANDKNKAMEISKNENSKQPNTGDSMNIRNYFIISLASIVLVVVLFRKNKINSK